MMKDMESLHKAELALENLQVLKKIDCLIKMRNKSAREFY